jgi:NADPH:quinone reductase
VKAAVYYQPGGPEVFRYEEVPDPVPGPDGVLIRVEAISIEGGDTLHRARGQLSAAPHIVGYQAAGTVLAAGPRVTSSARVTGS